MQSSTSKAGFNVEQQGDALVVRCEDASHLLDLAEQLDEICRSENVTAIIIDMNGVETIRGDGLETLMKLRDGATAENKWPALINVSFYIEQLASVLDLAEQIPPRFEDLKAAAETLQLDLTVENDVVDDFSFENEEDEESELTRTQKVDMSAYNRGAETVRMDRDELERKVHSDLLAVNFSDFKGPATAKSAESSDSDTFEIDLGVDFDEEETRHDHKIVAPEAVKTASSRQTEVFPAFRGIDDAPTESMSPLDPVTLEPKTKNSGLQALLAVDFDDFKPRSLDSSDTPPDGMMEFDLEEEEKEDKGPDLRTALPFADALDGGYSPVGSLDAPMTGLASQIFNPVAAYSGFSGAETQPMEIPAFDERELFGGVGSKDQSTELVQAQSDTVSPTPAALNGEAASVAPVSEPQEPPMPVPVSASNEAPPELVVPEATPSAAHEDNLATQMLPAITASLSDPGLIADPVPHETDKAQEPKSPEPADSEESELLSGDGEQSMMINVDQVNLALAGGYDSSSLYSGDGDDTMLLNIDQSDLSKHLAGLHFGTEELDSAKSTKRETESERLLRVDRDRLQEEKRLFEEERQRILNESQAVRREAEILREKEEARKAIEAELLHSQETQRKQLEAELAKIREDERKRLTAQIRQTQELERNMLREELMKAQDEQRKLLEAELLRAREEEQQRLRKEIEEVRNRTKRELEEQFRKSAQTERLRLEKELAKKKRKSTSIKRQTGRISKTSAVEVPLGVAKAERAAAKRATLRIKRQADLTRRDELNDFLTQFKIEAGDQLKILSVLHRRSGRAESCQDVARGADLPIAQTQDLLEAFVSARLIRRVRTTAVANRIAYKISSSPSRRNALTSLLRLTENGTHWPIPDSV